MVKNTLSRASLALLLAWGSSYAAEPAGRVLLLQGSATAVRGAQEVPLARGVTVETGDLLRVAEGSSLQVRFTDESVVALRANTQFKIEDYKFSENGTGDKSVFSLLKGGLRTITGLIGKRTPEAYAVRGITATIGIRGTHFSAVNCAGDCTNADGSQAEDGLYGGVTDGRIVVTNQAGESEFGREQYFVVTSSNTLPKPLLAPPSFLRDRLDGLAKAPKGGQGKAAEVSSSGSSSVLETTSPAVGVVANVVAGSLPTTPYAPANSPAAASSLKSEFGGGLYSVTWVDSNVEANAGFYGGFPFHSTGGSYYDYEANTNIFVNTILDYYLGAFTYSYSDTNELGYTDSGTETKTASVNNGSVTGTEGTVYWGRFQNTRNQTVPSIETTTEYTHWVTGPAVTAMPTSGTFTFTHVGGTQPTDQNGNVGTLTNGGAWTINFGARTINSAAPVTWTMPSGAAYSVNVINPFSLTTYTGSTTGTSNFNGVAGTSTSTYTGFNTISGSGPSYISCSGPCSAPAVEISPQPIGATASMLGVGIATSATVSGVPENTAQARVYKR